MSESKWIDLALKFGGFMEMDKVYLENRLASLTTDMDKYSLITPPASVVNAYFSELYQKRSPKDAVDYFLDYSKNFKNFNQNPNFGQEGKGETLNFRFIRLNLQGASYGFSFVNEKGDALVFPEDSKQEIKEEDLLSIAKIFPDFYVNYSLDSNRVGMKIQAFDDEEIINEKVLPQFPKSIVKYHKNFIEVETVSIEELKNLANLLGQACEKMVQFREDKYVLFIKS